MIRRIDHVAIAVQDLERARAFFVDGLGAREISDALTSDEHYEQSGFRALLKEPSL